MDFLFKFEAFKYLLLALATGLWLYWLWTRRNLYIFALKFPGIFGIPLLGNLYRISHPKDIILRLTQLFQKLQQDTVCFWAGTDPILITCDPVIAQKILASSELLNRPRFMKDTLKDIFNGGLFISSAEKWHYNRKLINPSFSHKVLISFFPIFNKAKKQTISKFDSMVGTGEIKLVALLQRISMGVSVETTMGKHMKENDEVDNQIVIRITFLLEALMKKLILTALRMEKLFLFSRRYQSSRKYVQNFLHELIKEKFQRLKYSAENTDQAGIDTEVIKENANESITKTPTIFIDQAIQIYQRHQFTLQDIISESLTLVIASSETSANGIASALIMLAMHPDIQEILYEEIISIFPQKDFEMEYEDLEKLPYLDMVLNETLRVLPPVPFITRIFETNIQLTEDILVPKGFIAMISIFHAHRNFNIWGPEADKFNPDNFLPHNVKEKHSHAFLPFSKGPRNCIGWRYAMFAMKVFLAGLVRNFRFVTSFKYDDLELVQNLSLKYYVEPGIETHRR